jgi:GNAT superfamily N-acetyltransferase
MELRDIDPAVGVHLAAFQNFFLTFLGPAFLRELYTAILQDSSGICFVCEGAGGVNGFVAGTDQPAGLYRRLLRQRWWRFGLASMAPALRRPAIVPRLLRAFSAPADVQDSTPPNCGLLMSVAVHPSRHGQNCGRLLVEAFLAEAAHRGLDAVALDTDRDNNKRVNEFYQRLGFVLVRSYVTTEGRQMNAYVIDLHSIATGKEAF